jgi:hypothetical protein
MGGTILSAAGFVGLALFEQYNSMLSDLRNDLKHFNETSSSFVKKDSFQRFRDQTKERFKETQDALGVKAQLEHELKVSEKARADMAQEMQRMRERMAYLEGRQSATPGMQPSSPPDN